MDTMKNERENTGKKPGKSKILDLKNPIDIAIGVLAMMLLLLLVMISIWAIES